MTLYREKSNIREVNAAIYSALYSDESVLLSDLIFYSEGRLASSNKFGELCKSYGINPGQFAKEFWKEVAKTNDKDLNQYLQKIKNNSVRAKTDEAGELHELSVYFPYSEEFNFTSDPVYSLATATADADEGWGYKSFYDDNGTIQWAQVVVDDDYAYNNPTHIIGVNGIEAYDYTGQVLDPNPPVPPPGVNRVFIGEGLCKKQYDRLISFTGNGGGSEIKYCHLSAYLQPTNGHVTSFQDIASVNFSRSDIRNKRWLRTFIVWDDDWVLSDFEQYFAIYEEDNTNTVTFNGSLSTTLAFAGTPTNTTTGTIGFTVSRQSQDDIIRELKISRNSYFTAAFQNQGWSFSLDDTFIPPPVSHGWPRYDGNENGGADVCWTWPYASY